MTALPDGHTLFRDADLVVRHVPGTGDRCVVTFAPLSDTPGTGNRGFGERFFAARTVPAVHVVPRGNHWYQYPATLAAMAAIRTAVQPYARVLAYGSSMGAYAALRLGPAAGAHAVLALSPQFSIRPARVPFEYRWTALGRAIVPLWEDTLPVRPGPEAYILHDPRDLDARHAALYAAHAATVPIRLPGAGHPVTGFLHGAGLLQNIALRAIAGPLDPAVVEAETWAARRRSPQYFRYMAERTQVGAWQVAALRRALALAPGDAGLISQLGRALGLARRFPEALDLHRQALAMHPDFPPLLTEYARTLAASGDLTGSLDALERLHAQGYADAAPRIAALRGHLSPVPGRRLPTVSQDPGARPPPDTPPILAIRNQAGFLLHGPLLELHPGAYDVTFTLAAPGEAPSWLDRRRACVLDVVIHNGRTVLAKRSVTAAFLRGASREVTLAFTMPEWTAVQFRARTTGRIALAIGAGRTLRRHRMPPSQPSTTPPLPIPCRAAIYWERYQNSRTRPT